MNKKKSQAIDRVRVRDFIANAKLTYARQIEDGISFQPILIDLPQVAKERVIFFAVSEIMENKFLLNRFLGLYDSAEAACSKCSLPDSFHITCPDKISFRKVASVLLEGAKEKCLTRSEILSIYEDFVDDSFKVNAKKSIVYLNEFKKDTLLTDIKGEYFYLDGNGPYKKLMKKLYEAFAICKCPQFTRYILHIEKYCDIPFWNITFDKLYSLYEPRGREGNDHIDYLRYRMCVGLSSSPAEDKRFLAELEGSAKLKPYVNVAYTVINDFPLQRSDIHSSYIGHQDGGTWKLINQYIEGLNHILSKTSVVSDADPDRPEGWEIDLDEAAADISAPNLENISLDPEVFVENMKGQILERVESIKDANGNFRVPSPRRRVSEIEYFQHKLVYGMFCLASQWSSDGYDFGAAIYDNRLSQKEVRDVVVKAYILSQLANLSKDDVNLAARLDIFAEHIVSLYGQTIMIRLLNNTLKEDTRLSSRPQMTAKKDIYSARIEELERQCDTEKNKAEDLIKANEQKDKRIKEQDKTIRTLEKTIKDLQMEAGANVVDPDDDVDPQDDLITEEEIAEIDDSVIINNMSDEQKEAYFRDIIANTNVMIYGARENLQRRLESSFPDLIFASTRQALTNSMLNKTDMVIIRIDKMSHSHYKKAKAQVKEANIPVRHMPRGNFNEVYLYDAVIDMYEHDLG